MDLISCQAQTETLAAGATVVVSAVKETTPRLAVVPFEVMSTDPDDEYLASGLVEDLIVDLTRLKELYVPSRAEVAPYAERKVPPRTLARELGVDYLLLGSVRRNGNRARISAHLVRAGDGHTVWADRFDRTLEDMFAIQEEISREIVSALQVALRPGESEILKRVPTTNTEAYKLYLRSLELLDNNRESNLRAERLLKDALELDPDFALAHAALGRCYALRPMRWWGGLEMIEPAKQCIAKALELDPDLPDAVHVDLLVKILTAPEELVPAIESVIAISPDAVPALVWAGWGYLTMDRPKDAIPILEKLPDRYMAVSFLANAYEMLGRDSDAERMDQRLRELTVKDIERDPEAVHQRSLLAGSLARAGETKAAIHQAERAVALDPQDGRARYNAACAYSILGRPEKAIEHLKQAIENLPSVGSIAWLKHDPDLEAVRHHPAYEELLRIGMTGTDAKPNP